jgi:threonine synthase
LETRASLAEAVEALAYRCQDCGRTLSVDEPVWRCVCGGLLELAAPAGFTRELIDRSEPGLWRYGAALPQLAARAPIRLGEVMTPLVDAQFQGNRLHFKLDYLLPTGSYKDRGAATLISQLRALGVREVVDDSSGNAGAAAAAYCAAAGIGCTIYTPAGNSPAKLAQIQAYGATLERVHGDRAAVAQATLERARRTFYASHNRQPLYTAGIATLGYEIWEQLGYRAPSDVVVPAGYGSIVLGLARAFEALALSGEIQRRPAIHAVQSEAYPALTDAFRSGAADVAAAGGESATLAEGIACRQPIHGRTLLGALRSSGGSAVTVAEDEIKRALLDLARAGFYVEPTSAAAAAGLRRLALGPGPVVLVLTGSGLKASARIAELIGAANAVDAAP